MCTFSWHWQSKGYNCLLLPLWCRLCGISRGTGRLRSHCQGSRAGVPCRSTFGPAHTDRRGATNVALRIENIFVVLLSCTVFLTKVVNSKNVLRHLAEGVYVYVSVCTNGKSYTKFYFMFGIKPSQRQQTVEFSKRTILAKSKSFLKIIVGNRSWKA
jgi:hypothetical protein